MQRHAKNAPPRPGDGESGSLDLPRLSAVRRGGKSCALVLLFATAALTGDLLRADDSAASAKPQREQAIARPLHQVIDERIAVGWTEREITPASLSSDSEFLRRIYLDLTGTIPTAADARAFLENTNPNKRRALVDRLLGSPEYARQMARVFDVMLMERRRDVHVPQKDWAEYLRTSFAQNKPWDQLTRELLEADGADPETRPAAKFYLDRLAETHLLTRDVGRLFLGMDMQCAQCHDHPVIWDYRQADYYGVFAFLNRSSLFLDKKQKASLEEKAEGEVKFSSVFEPDRQNTTLPRLPDGQPVEEPKFEKDQQYEVAPAKGVRCVPKYSRRMQLARRLPTAEVPAFARNAVNRLWAFLMGRGLVEPLDMHHSENLPSHPELLEEMADRFVELKFDIKSFLRELALSETYQRSSLLPEAYDGDVPPETFAVAQLRPLTAEQLAWATMQATGLTDVQRSALGDKLSEQTLHDKLAGNEKAFVQAFGGPAGQPESRFHATVGQALFLSNGSKILNWLKPRKGNLVDRLTQCSDTDALAEELYLSVLTRRPSEQERTEVAEYLQERSEDRVTAIRELAWALLASAEFRFNH